MYLDSTDYKILDQLQQNSAITNVELAKRVHLSPSPCLNRVKALEASGVIQKYVALTEPKASLREYLASTKGTNAGLNS